jgi:hypothetical protein
LREDGTSTHAVTSLESEVRKRLNEAVQSGGFVSMQITAAPGDGVSTAARMIADDLQSGKPMPKWPGHPKVLLLTGPTSAGDPWDGLDRLVPPRTLARVARDHGLNAPRARGRVLIGLGIFVAVVGANLLTTLGQSILPSGTPWISGNLLRTVVSVALGIAAWLITELVKILWRHRTRRASGQDISQELAQQTRAPGYPAFITAIANYVRQSARFRCVIVDDLSQVDSLVRHVATAYRNEIHHERDDDPELWVIFDTTLESSQTARGAGLSEQGLQLLAEGLHAMSNRQRAVPSGVRHTTRYRLSSLDTEQRHELAERAGHPERGSLETVGDVLKGGAPAEPPVIDRLRQARRQGSVKVDEALRLFYLLSVDALQRPNQTWDEDELTRMLARRSHLDALLLAIIGTKPKLGDARAMVKSLRKEPFSAAGSSPGAPARGVRLDIETARAMVDNLVDFDFVPRELVHLFWGMYWADRNGPDTGRLDAVWINKIAEHFRRAAAPYHFATRIDADLSGLADELFNTVLSIARACVRLCLVACVPHLLVFAADLIESDIAAEREKVERLRTVCRDCYFVLRDDRILTLILDLEADADVTAPAHSVLASSPLLLFIRSVDSRANLPELDRALRRGARLGALETYGSLRGAWFSLSLQPFLGAALLQLAQIVANARASIESRATAALKAVQATPTVTGRLRQWSAGDYVALNLSLWSWALAGEQRRVQQAMRSAVDQDKNADPLGSFTERGAAAFARVLAEAYGVGSKLRDERVRLDRSGDLDLVLDALAAELLCTTLACALFVLEAWAPAEESLLRELEGLAGDIADDLGLRVNLSHSTHSYREVMATALERQMTALQVTWNGLGFYQQARDLGIRRGQFAYLHDRMTARSVALDDQLGEPGLAGLLSNAVLADHADGHTGREHSAVLLIRGVAAAIEGGLDEDFCSQLCMVGLRQSQGTDSVGLADLLQYLLSPADPSRWQPGRSRLDVQLQTIPDGEWGTVALWICNAAVESDSRELLLDAARRRTAECADVEQAALATDLLDLSQVEAMLTDYDPSIVDQILNDWSSRHGSIHYPALLLRLLRCGAPLSGQLRAETANALGSWPQYLRVSGNLHLAMHIAAELESASGPDDLDLAGKAFVAMEGTHPHFEYLLRPDDNLEILILMWHHRHDSFKRYRQRYDYWNSIKLRIDMIERVPQVLRSGQFARMLLDHAQMFRPYGLPVTGKAPAAVTAEWLSTARLVPLVSTPTGDAVSLPFLAAVRALFGAAFRAEPAFEEMRRAINEEARAALDRFYTVLVRIEGLDESLKTLLTGFRQQVVERLLEASTIDG